MDDLTIILQGVVNPLQIELWKTNHKNSKVIISTWVDCKFNFDGWLPKNWKLIINPYPLLRFAPTANLDYQIISTLSALNVVDTKWVIKMRADEYWSNLDKIYNFYVSYSNFSIRNLWFIPAIIKLNFSV